MKDMSSFTSAIATSVQQQAAATRSISDAVRVVADHSARARDGVAEIERIARQNVATAAEIVEWTSRLSAGANHTERQIDEFFAQVRSPKARGAPATTPAAPCLASATSGANKWDCRHAPIRGTYGSADASCITFTACLKSLIKWMNCA